MLNKIIKFSLNNKLLVLLAVLLVTVAGIYSTQKIDIEEIQQKVEANFDGSHKVLLQPGDRIQVSRSPKTTEIVKLSEVSFLEVLHKKMSGQ